VVSGAQEAGRFRARERRQGWALGWPGFISARKRRENQATNPLYKESASLLFITTFWVSNKNLT